MSSWIGSPSRAPTRPWSQPSMTLPAPSERQRLAGAVVRVELGAVGGHHADVVHADDVTSLASGLSLGPSWSTVRTSWSGTELGVSTSGTEAKASSVVSVTEDSVGSEPFASEPMGWALSGSDPPVTLDAGVDSLEDVIDSLPSVVAPGALVAGRLVDGPMRWLGRRSAGRLGRLGRGRLASVDAVAPVEVAVTSLVAGANRLDSGVIAAPTRRAWWPRPARWTTARSRPRTCRPAPVSCPPPGR